MSMSMLAVILLPIVFVINLVRQDDAYAALLRRNDVPELFPS